MIKKLRDSIQTCPLNLVLFFVVFALYHLNNYILKSKTSGILNHILTCHFNDFMGGLLFVAYTNVILLTRKNMLSKLPHILLFCLGAGLFWEFATPLFYKDTVSDWIDVGCYILGGFVYWLLLKKTNVQNVQH